MGSDSDWPVMAEAGEALAEFDIGYEADVVSAHRMPEAMITYGREAHGRGLQVIIAGAGGAAHLPGMLASVTPLPVIGVPVPLKHLDGLDSLLSIVQMPTGVPVATVAIGNARNAGLLAVRILAVGDDELTDAVIDLLRTACARPRRPRASASGVRPTRTDQSSAVVGEFIAGVRLLARGFTLVLKRPRLFWLGAVPPLIMSVLFAGVLAVVDHPTPRARRLAHPLRRRLVTELAAGRRGAGGHGPARRIAAADGDLLHHLDPGARLTDLRQDLRVRRSRVRARVGDPRGELGSRRSAAACGSR